MFNGRVWQQLGILVAFSMLLTTLAAIGNKWCSPSFFTRQTEKISSKSCDNIYLKLQTSTGTRTVAVISKIDQAASDPKILAAVQALLLGRGPQTTADIPWVALIGQSVSIASAQSGSAGTDYSLETDWRAESVSLEPLKASLVD